MSIIYLGKATPASGQGGGGSGEAEWGDITGTLSDQTDLQTALNAKQDELTAGTGIDITNATISVDGELTSTVTLATVATSGDYVDLSNKPLPFSGATGTMDGTSGLVPKPIATDYDKFLKGDGTWGIPSGGLQNTATGSSSLTILGTPASNNYSINIGDNSQSSGGVAIGYQSSAFGVEAVTIGNNAQSGDTFSNTDHTIQIGSGTNSESKTMYVGFGWAPDYSVRLNYKLLDGMTGKIPNDRINVDVSPTQNSTNFVTSGTIYTVLGDIETLLAAI